MQLFEFPLISQIIYNIFSSVKFLHFHLWSREDLNLNNPFVSMISSIRCAVFYYFLIVPRYHHDRAGVRLNRRCYKILWQLTIHSHPEHEKRHAVELSAAADAKPKALHAAAELHREELVLVSQVSPHLLVLLKQNQTSKHDHTQRWSIRNWSFVRTFGTCTPAHYLIDASRQWRYFWSGCCAPGWPALRARWSPAWYDPWAMTHDTWSGCRGAMTRLPGLGITGLWTI